MVRGGVESEGGNTGGEGKMEERGDKKTIGTFG